MTASLNPLTQALRPNLKDGALIECTKNEA